MAATVDTLRAFNRGEDRKSPGHLIPDGFVAYAQNARFTDGVPEKVGGYVRFFSTADGRPPDGGDVLFAVQHILGAARLFLLFTDSNRVYTYNDSLGTFTLRRRIPGTLDASEWWAVGFGATKIIGDSVNLPWRLDEDGRLTPLSGARMAGFEATETWALGGGGITDNGADTREDPIAFIEGTQGHRFTWTSGANQRITLAGTFDIRTSPYGIAPNFTTADPGHAQVHLRVYVNSGQANYSSGFIQFDDGTDANYRRFAFPGALAAGENLLILNYSTSTTNGAPPTTGAARISLSIITGLGGTLDVTFDDLYIAYQNAGPIGADFGEVHKSILFQAGDDIDPFRIFFSNPNNPSYSTPTDTLDVFDKVALDAQIEIRGLKSFFDTLIVGTWNTIFGVNGSDRDTFTISEQSSGQGLSDHRSFAPYGDTFLYRFRSRIYAYSVSQLRAISLPIDPVLRAIDEDGTMVAMRWIKRNCFWFTYRSRNPIIAEVPSALQVLALTVIQDPPGLPPFVVGAAVHVSVASPLFTTAHVGQYARSFGNEGEVLLTVFNSATSMEAIVRATVPGGGMTAGTWRFIDPNAESFQRILQWDYGSGQQAWSELTIPAVAVFPYTSASEENELITLHEDGLLYLQDRGAQFDGVDFDAIIETRWLGAESAPRVRKWVEAQFLAETNNAVGMQVQWRVANSPGEMASAAWSAALTLNETSLAEGTIQNIGEYGRFFQVRVTQTTSVAVLAQVYPQLSADPFFKYTDDDPAFIGEEFRVFRLMPPLTVKSYPLRRRV